MPEYLQRDGLCSDIQREKVLCKDVLTITAKKFNFIFMLLLTLLLFSNLVKHHQELGDLYSK